MVQLENSEVATLFETTTEKDLVINTLGYVGLLSKVTLVGAMNMMASHSQYLKVKPLITVEGILLPIVELPIVEPQITADIVTQITVGHESTAQVEHVEPTQ